MALSEDHDDVSATLTRVPNELKLMFAEKLEIRDVSALARTCRGMNALLTLYMYRRAKDSKVTWGRPYFLLAVDDDILAAVERFVEVGADVNMTHTVGGFPVTAMHSCAHFGHVEMAEFLIGKGIDVSAADRVDFGIMHSLVRGKDPKETMATLLVEAGAGVNTLYGRDTPLLWAAMRGDVPIVQRLLDLGADPNAADENGSRPVHLAAVYSNAATVRCLLEAENNIEIADDEGHTPLREAVQRGKAETVKVLLEMGADISSVDWEGWTPLHGAVYTHGNEATVHRILELDATKTYECQPWCRFDKTNHTIIEMLLAAGADIAKSNNYGSSPLSWAVARHTQVYIRRPGYPTYR